MTDPVKFKAGYLALIGRPNVGKSTLLNKLLDYKLSITSPRPQTTRRRLMGIMNGTSYQIIFLDTPGILEQSKYELQQVMIRQVQLAIADADALVYMVEAFSGNPASEQPVAAEVELVKKMNPARKPVLLIINKIDLGKKSDLLPLLDLYNQQYPFQALIPVSALKGDGLTSLLKEFLAVLPWHPPYYDADTLTDQPEKFFVAELIREQVFLHFGAEIPYCTEVVIEEFKERESRKDYIRAVIFTERDSQKGILIGKKGSALGKIGLQARVEIEKFLQREVYLELRVKVRKNWRRDKAQLKHFGYNE
jgi:GTP-binding protein Era